MDAKRQKYQLLTKVENHRQSKSISTLRENCGFCDLDKCYISKPEIASLNQRNERATSC